MTEPNLTRGVADGLFSLYKRTDEIYPNQQIAVLMYSPPFITQRREVGQRFMLAYLQGVRDYWNAFARGQNKAEVIDILTRWTTLKDAALYERMAPAGPIPMATSTWPAWPVTSTGGLPTATSRPPPIRRR